MKNLDSIIISLFVSSPQAAAAVANSTAAIAAGAYVRFVAAAASEIEEDDSNRELQKLLRVKKRTSKTKPITSKSPSLLCYPISSSDRNRVKERRVLDKRMLDLIGD